MDLKTKLAYTANHIDSIARHADEAVDLRMAALDRVIRYAEAAKATAQEAPHLPPKVAIATDEPAIRRKIAAVQALMEGETDAAKLRTLRDLEATLGAMLPPVTGTLVVGAAPATLDTQA